MKRFIAIICAYIFLLVLSGCKTNQEPAYVVATTKPVYDFTAYLCQGTDVTVSLLVTENVSCLHDYTLQVQQMRSIEGAQMVVISGAGLEEFLHDALQNANHITDASQGIALHCGEADHQHNDARR